MTSSCTSFWRVPRTCVHIPSEIIRCHALAFIPHADEKFIIFLSLIASPCLSVARRTPPRGRRAWSTTATAPTRSEARPSRPAPAPRHDHLRNRGASRHAPARNCVTPPSPSSPSGDYSFSGRIKYWPCRRGVLPPSFWNPAVAERSAKLPEQGLHLEFVHGYAGRTNTAPNLYYLANGNFVYYVAGVAIVYDKLTHEQHFFFGE